MHYTMPMRNNAYPYLTLDQIKVILQHTAVKDSYYTNADIWGRGKIDAYAGLQFLLQQLERTRRHDMLYGSG